MFQELTIDKDPGEKLGLSIKGGAKHLTTPDRSDEGIFISRVGLYKNLDMKSYHFDLTWPILCRICRKEHGNISLALIVLINILNVFW